MAQSIFYTKSSGDTQKLARKLAKRIKPGSILTLEGELGSGKTTFVQALAQALGIRQHLTSPTFVYLRKYPLDRRGFFIHVDLYRASEIHDVMSVHLLDYIGPNNIVVIEWPEIMVDFLPSHTINIQFAHGDKCDDRIITIQSNSTH